jgi:hypothetical protein
MWRGQEPNPTSFFVFAENPTYGAANYLDCQSYFEEEKPTIPVGPMAVVPAVVAGEHHWCQYKHTEINDAQRLDVLQHGMLNITRVPLRLEGWFIPSPVKRSYRNVALSPVRQVDSF